MVINSGTLTTAPVESRGLGATLGGVAFHARVGINHFQFDEIGGVTDSGEPL